VAAVGLHGMRDNTVVMKGNRDGSSSEYRAGPLYGFEYVLGNPLASDSWLSPLRDRPGSGPIRGNSRGTRWRFAKAPDTCYAVWHCLQLVLLCSSGARPLYFCERG